MAQAVADNKTDEEDVENAEDKKEREVCEHWNNACKSLLENQEDIFKLIQNGRDYVSGQAGDDKEPGLVRANFLHSDIKADINRIYAKDPEIAITPQEQVDPAGYEQLKGFSLTSQIVVNRSLADAGLKRKAKACVRAAETAKIAWLKVGYQRDYQTDPIIQSRINDVQDNIEKLNAASRKINEDDFDDNWIEKFEAEVLLESLKKKVEVLTAEGLVIDRVLSEHIILDTSIIRDFDSYKDAPYIIHLIPMSADKVKERWNQEPSETHGFVFEQLKGKKQEDDKKKGDKETKIVLVMETWHKDTQTVYTQLYGSQKFLVPPYSPERTGQQWYPFFPLGLDKVDGQFYPLSKVERLKSLQDEHNAIRTQAKSARESHRDHIIIRKGVFTDQDKRNMANPPPDGIVEVEGQPGTPLQQDIAPGINFPLDIAKIDTTPIREDWERTSGSGDANQGFINQAKTATEAAILDESVSKQSSGDQDEIEDWISDIAKYVYEILLQELSIDQVRKVAGPGAIWFEGLEKEDIYNLVKLEIRAGSSGKPNKGLEQQRWIQFGPQLRELATSIFEMREKGAEDLAESLTKLWEHGLRVFDEKIDIESFMPKKKEGDGIDPLKAEEIQQKLEAQALELEALKAQILKTNSETEKNLADAEQTKTETALNPAIELSKNLADNFSPSEGPILIN